MLRRALESVLVERARPVMVAEMVEVMVLASPMASRLAMKSWQGLD